MPDTASYITHSLMKDGVPSENSEVGINFVFGSKVKSKLCSKSYLQECDHINRIFPSFCPMKIEMWYQPKAHILLTMVKVLAKQCFTSML